MDNCSTNDAMLDAIINKLFMNDSLLLGGKILHMSCCVHILNLIVKDGLEVIGEGIERIHDSIHFWTATPSRVEKFEEAARQLRVQSTKKLALDCRTGWNSTYVILQTAMVYKNVFPRLNQREKHYTSVPSDDDWRLAKEI